MKLLKRLINSNTFIFKNGEVRQVTAHSDDSVAKKFEGSLLPVLIIAREHYQEIEKEYPVPDKKDVQSIIDNEFQNLKMTRIQQKDLNTSKVKIFSFDSVSENFIRQNFCIYIPETMLSRFLREQELTTVDRLGQTLNLVRKGETVFSSSGLGLYQNPQLFLASSGIGEATSTHSMQQGEYFELVLEQLCTLKSDDALMILSAQIAHKRFLQSLHFPSLGAGVALSLLVYWGILWGQLKWTEEYASTDYSSSDVKEVIQLKNDLEGNVTLYNELNNAQGNHITGEIIWNMVASLLEADVSVGSLFYENEELKLNLVSSSATEAIQFLRGLSVVENVIVDGDIYDVQGKQSVQIVVLFKKVTSDV